MIRNFIQLTLIDCYLSRNIRARAKQTCIERQRWCICLLFCFFLLVEIVQYPQSSPFDSFRNLFYFNFRKLSFLIESYRTYNFNYFVCSRIAVAHSVCMSRKSILSTFISQLDRFSHSVVVSPLLSFLFSFVFAFACYYCFVFCFNSFHLEFCRPQFKTLEKNHQNRQKYICSVSIAGRSSVISILPNSN